VNETWNKYVTKDDVIMLERPFLLCHLNPFEIQYYLPALLLLYEPKELLGG
jgi:hypothetical protein